MSKPNNSFTPIPGDVVHFRRRAMQSDLGILSKGCKFEKVRTEVVVEAVGDVEKVIGDGCVLIKMTSFQDDLGTWVSIRNINKGVMMRVHMDDIDL